MCGISAIFSYKDKLKASTIEKMNSVIAHRGPDDEGFVLFQPSPKVFGGKDSPSDLPYPNLDLTQNFHAALGHRRLSILDLSLHGHQPMCCQDKRYWITYNGEIYNYKELRSELVKKGHTFQSHTDTEVILKSFEEYGSECLHQFNGMFAFVIYDSHTGKIFAARDRFAVKPLYYWTSPNGFLAFASEIKQFTKLTGWEAKLNRKRGYDFLTYGITNHTEETLFEGVYALKGGWLLEGAVDAIKTQQWYQLPVSDSSLSFNEASTQFRDLFKDSIRLRLRADVEVGSCLSGGLDSSSIVCVMNQMLQDSNKQRTFSACSNHKAFDETDYIQHVVEKTQVKAHYTTPELNSLFDQLEKLVWHQDEPFGSTSIFAQWEVFKLAHENSIKVMLDGQGADEQLAGYFGYFKVHLKDLLHRKNYLKFFKEGWAYKRKHKSGSSFLLLLKKYVNREPAFQWINTAYLTPSPPPGNEAKGVNQLSYAQVTSTNLPMLLHFEDRNSMAHSIESRTPFIDYRLVEFIQSLPSDYKLSKGTTKRVLREGMKGILPEKIRNRRDKLGFATPEEVWVCDENPDMFKHAVRKAVEEYPEIFHRETIDLCDHVIDRKMAFNNIPWRVLVFAEWMRTFQVSRESLF